MEFVCVFVCWKTLTAHFVETKSRISVANAHEKYVNVLKSMSNKFWQNVPGDESVFF